MSSHSLFYHSSAASAAASAETGTYGSVYHNAPSSARASGSRFSVSPNSSPALAPPTSSINQLPPLTPPLNDSAHTNASASTPTTASSDSTSQFLLDTSAAEPFDDMGDTALNSSRKKRGRKWLTRSRRHYVTIGAVSLFVACCALAIFLIVRHFVDNNSNSPPDDGWDGSQYADMGAYYYYLPVHNFNANDLTLLERISDPILSPNGRQVVFTHTQFRYPSANTSCTNLWMMRLPRAFDTISPDIVMDILKQQSTPKALTRPQWGYFDTSPVWTPDSRALIFLSNRTPNKRRQIFTLTIPVPQPIPSVHVREPVTLANPFYMFGSLSQSIIGMFSTSAAATSKSSSSSLTAAPTAVGLGDGDDPDVPPPPDPTAEPYFSSFVQPTQLTFYDINIDTLLVSPQMAPTVPSNPPPSAVFPSTFVCAFSASIFLNTTLEESGQILDERIILEQTELQEGLGHSEGVVEFYGELLVREKTKYREELRRNHVFLMPLVQTIDAGDVHVLSADPSKNDLPNFVVDAMRSELADSPVNGGSEQWSFSAPLFTPYAAATSSSVLFAYTRRESNGDSSIAWLTDTNIYVLNISMSFPLSARNFPDGSTDYPTLHVSQSLCLTCDNPAADRDPLFSPTIPNQLVYRAQMTANYAAARYHLMSCVFGEWTDSQRIINAVLTDTTPQWDKSAEALTWSIDSTQVYVHVIERALKRIYRLNVSDNILPEPSPAMFVGPPVLVSDFDGISSPITSTSDGKILLFSISNFSMTDNLWVYFPINQTSLKLTHFNQIVLSKTLLPSTDAVTLQGAGNDDVSGFFFPPIINASAPKPPQPVKYPLVILLPTDLHGLWLNSWSFHYHPAVFTGSGFAVFMLNPHGSMSYSSNFTDSLQGDLVSKREVDIIMSVKYLLSTYSDLLDKNNIFLVGSGYGGYYVNWMMGNNTMQETPFRGFISFGGIVDLKSFYLSTDYLFELEYELKGPPALLTSGPICGNYDTYTAYSPVQHMIQWSAPVLFIHGTENYRMDVTQSLSAFTGCQRIQKAKCSLLLLPGESTNVLNSLNVRWWYDAMIDFINTHRAI